MQKTEKITVEVELKNGKSKLIKRNGKTYLITVEKL